MATGGGGPQGHGSAVGERFRDAVPRTMFIVRSTPARLVVAVGVGVALGLPLFVVSDPAELRLGPLLVLGLVAVATVTGWRPAAIAGGLVLILYWWRAIPPSDSLRIDTFDDLVALVGMAGVVAGVVLVTRRVERGVEDVRALYQRIDYHARGEAILRGQAEAAAEEVIAVLALSQTLSEATSMAAVARAALQGIDIPARPDTGSVSIVEGKHLRVLASDNALPASAEALQQIDVTTTPWLGDVLRGQAALVDDGQAFAAENPSVGTLAANPEGSWAVVPFRSENTVGLLSVHFADTQPVRAHRAYFSLVAEILATALERAQAQERQQHNVEALAQAFAERDRIARTLSQMLLPAKLPALSGFSASAWLTPASPDEVSGDFYDVFPVGGDWVAVLGDVCGKGAEAAAVTSLARYAARVAALDVPEPPHIAAVANQALIEDPSELFCTMAVIRFTRSVDGIEVTLAGHPQPRLISKGTVSRVGRFARPLGLSEYDTEGETYPFEPGDILVLFSDGLTERNGDFGEDQLDAALASWGDLDVHALSAALQDLVRHLAVERHDDLAVLVIGRDRAG